MQIETAKDASEIAAAVGELVPLTAGRAAVREAVVASGAVGPLAKAWRTQTVAAKGWAHDSLKNLGFDDDGIHIKKVTLYFNAPTSSLKPT